MLCSCSHVCVNMSRVRYPHKCCFTWYYYIDSCNTRYALNFQKFSGGNTPEPPRQEGATPSRTQPQHCLWPLAVRKRPRCRNSRFQKRSPKSKIATTPLVCVISPTPTTWTTERPSWHQKNSKIVQGGPKNRTIFES